ncbi:DUF4296 domain-containing protein [Arachidicoccus sp.]|jgi:hypothetical protein|uniref:DUF4296 domain-containing protein n=1 Tax=Arachidicoccus sp. TaxID=1872624 RepID=UPI003D248840
MKIKPFLFLTIAVLLFSACNDKLPDGILAPPVMKNIMWEMMVAEQVNRLDTSRTYKLHIKDSSTLSYNEILAIHKTSYQAYIKSLKYYEAHPDEFKEIFDSLSTYGKRLNDSLEPLAKVSLKKKLLPKDSLPASGKSDSNKLKAKQLEKPFVKPEVKGLKSL